MTRLVLEALVLLNCASFTTKLFAQASQTAPPVPLTPPSLNTTTVTCQINCDTPGNVLPELLRSCYCRRDEWGNGVFQCN